MNLKRKQPIMVLLAWRDLNSYFIYEYMTCNVWYSDSIQGDSWVCRVFLRGPLTNLYVWWVWLQVAWLRKFVAMIWPPWSSTEQRSSDCHDEDASEGAFLDGRALEWSHEVCDLSCDCGSLHHSEYSVTVLNAVGVCILCQKSRISLWCPVQEWKCFAACGTSDSFVLFLRIRGTIPCWVTSFQKMLTNEHEIWCHFRGISLSIFIQQGVLKQTYREVTCIKFVQWTCISHIARKRVAEQ